MINNITPQPIPIQEQPRPKPNLFCNQSNNQSNKTSFINPEKQPGLLFIAFSFGLNEEIFNPDSLLIYGGVEDGFQLEKRMVIILYASA